MKHYPLSQLYLPSSPLPCFSLSLPGVATLTRTLFLLQWGLIPVLLNQEIRSDSHVLVNQAPAAPDTKLILALIHLQHDAQSLNKIRMQRFEMQLVVEHHEESLALQKKTFGDALESQPRKNRLKRCHTFLWGKHACGTDYSACECFPEQVSWLSQRGQLLDPFFYAFPSFLLIPSLLIPTLWLPYFSGHAPHPLSPRLWHLLSLFVNQLNLAEEQKTIQVSSCALSSVKCAHRWEWGVHDRESASPLPSGHQLLKLIKSQEMVPLVTLFFSPRRCTLKDAVNKLTYTERRPVGKRDWDNPLETASGKSLQRCPFKEGFYSQSSRTPERTPANPPSTH